MKKVLILEDNPKTSELLKGLVEKADSFAMVLLAGCADEAYTYAMKYTVDLFLVDLMLDPGKKGGDMSGAEFVQKIRGVKKYFLTPVIIVTSLYDTKMYLYSETHCFQFVEKPFDPDRMKSLIEKVLQNTTRSEEQSNWYYRMDGMVGAVPVGEIIYAKSQKEIMKIITVRECIQISYKTCQEMLDELDTHDFEMCQRGVIVNRKFIQRIDFTNRYIYLKNCNDVLEIGPYLKRRFKRWFLEE